MKLVHYRKLDHEKLYLAYSRRCERNNSKEDIFAGIIRPLQTYKLDPDYKPIHGKELERLTVKLYSCTNKEVGEHWVIRGFLSNMDFYELNKDETLLWVADQL